MSQGRRHQQEMSLRVELSTAHSCAASMVTSEARQTPWFFGFAEGHGESCNPWLESKEGSDIERSTAVSDHERGRFDWSAAARSPVAGEDSHPAMLRNTRA